VPVKNVEQYLEEKSDWTEGLTKLRDVLAKTELDEGIKWGIPCYSFGKKNVVGFAAFKNHIALSFFQGAVIPDPDQLFINCQPGKTQAMRQMRFEKISDIKVRTVAKYIKAAIAASKDGKEIKPRRNQELVVPEQLQAVLKKDKKLNAAFEKLTPGKKREYCTHILEAKQEKTKASRIQKMTPMILAGIGLNDKYRNC